MKVRDYDYIEARLFAPITATEAIERLREVGRPELGERIMLAAQVFTDECRAVRYEIQGQRGTK